MHQARLGRHQDGYEAFMAAMQPFLRRADNLDQDDLILDENIAVPNPQWPLKFEKLAGTEEKDAQFLQEMREVAVLCDSCISTEQKALKDAGGQSLFSDPRKSEMYRAAVLALQAHAIINDGAAAAQARKALLLCDICPEAYIVLALRDANTYEEALAYFNTAMEQGQQIKSPDDLKKVLDTTVLWEKVEMRAYMRGVFGVGNNLHKMGRCIEALPYYEQLYKLNNKWRPSWTTFLNFNAHFPQLWFEIYGPAECLNRMVTHIPSTCSSEPACRASWLATMALVVFATGEYTDFKALAFDFNDVRDVKTRLKENCWYIMLDSECPEVAEVLLGKQAMPKAEKIPASIPRPTSLIQAAVYAQECGHLWRNTPGAMEFLLKMRNTSILQRFFVKAMTDTTFDREKVDVAYCLELIEEGLFPNSNSVHYGMTLLEMAQKEHDLAISLIRHGANANVCNIRGVCPLYTSCYTPAKWDIIRAMVEEGGGNIYKPSDQRDPPILLAVEQGNWQTLDNLLTIAPIGNRKFLTVFEPHKTPVQTKIEPIVDCIYDRIFYSECTACMTGLTKCNRCRQTLQPKHSPDVDFRKTIDVLLRHGVKPDVAYYEKCKKWINPHSDTFRLDIIPLKTLVRFFLCRWDGQAESVEWCSDPLCCYTNSMVDLKVCSGCRKVKYCSTDCQKSHWKMHKIACKKFQARERGEEE